MKRTIRYLPLVLLLLARVAPAADFRPDPTGSPAPLPVIGPQQIEADWLRQDAVRNLAALESSGEITPRLDAAGGCDGVKNGKAGFCTAEEENPWWQIDLGRKFQLDQVLIYNRCDEFAGRAAELRLLLSDDGETFTEAYRHDGTTFYGISDKSPLAISLQASPARYVRVQLPGKTCLGLDEIEIFQIHGQRNMALSYNNGQILSATQSSTSEFSTRPAFVPSDKTGAVTSAEDAAGACDGLIDGKWGFHTGESDPPWWQVDLGEIRPLDRAVIYNRCDGASERASRIKLLLSEDGKDFASVYQHDGTVFYGQSDGKPLSVPLEGKKARYLRIESPGQKYLHLDEVQVFSTQSDQNLALGRPADQCSASAWSHRAQVVSGAATYPIQTVLARAFPLAESLRGLGVDVRENVALLQEIARRAEELPADAPENVRRELYMQARWCVRKMALANPLLDFDDLLFVKRRPSGFTHMSDQYLGWFSQPGGGLYVLKNFKSDAPQLVSLTESFPEGNIIRPDVSYDGKRVLFAWCKYYPGLKDEKNKLDKANVPEDSFYHLFEMNLDGTGLRQLTHGKYNDFDGRYLPGGEIVFLSTRRGQYIQCGKNDRLGNCDVAGPECYVRCGGGPERPCAVYTLHVMGPDGGNLREISAFEMFEWTPSIDHQGRIIYTRWDYVDRDNMPFMSLWSTMPDGTKTQALFGNFNRKPHCVMEPRAIPGSNKIVFTASGHHSVTLGSLVLLDLNKGAEEQDPMTRLTPEVPFPEIEAFPTTYYANPYPLSEEHYLVAWSDVPVVQYPGANADAALGIYLYDAFGNLNLIYRDAEIGSAYPLPIRSRPEPHQVNSLVNWEGRQEGDMLLINVYEGLETIPRGSIRNLRLVGVPAKTHPTMNFPSLGMTADDPGKFVLGTVPVEEDGSAHFRVPSGVTFFMQALDARGMAVQTMRSGVYLQPGESHTCVGCHEPRHTAPPNVMPLASLREPSKIAPGPPGTWPMDYQELVQSVLDRRCVECHKPGTDGAAFDLTSEKSYDTLVNYGPRSLKTHVLTRYRQGRSTPGGCAAATSPLITLLDQGHYDVTLTPDDYNRLIIWMDTYAQRTGSFSEDQQQRLKRLREKMAAMMAD
jgi:hypothetical protein